MNQKKVDNLYTGYVIFTKKNCGNDFLSKVGDGTVGLDVYDIKAGDSQTTNYYWSTDPLVRTVRISLIKAMYSADGIYHRDAGDSSSSAVFQFTKTKNGWSDF